MSLDQVSKRDHPSAMSDSIKLALMGGAALIAVIIAVVVGVKTFSDGGSGAVSVKVPVAGVWERNSEQQPGGIPGVPTGMVLDITGVDASKVDGGTIKLTMRDGTTKDAKILSTNPGFMLVQIEGKRGEVGQLNLGLMSEKGPLMVSDGMSSVSMIAKP